MEIINKKKMTFLRFLVSKWLEAIVRLVDLIGIIRHGADEQKPVLSEPTINSCPNGPVKSPAESCAARANVT